jgi:hypothetical protein
MADAPEADTGGSIPMLGAGVAGSSEWSLAAHPTLVSTGQAYNPGDAKEIDRAIRNMPGVARYCQSKAHELLSSIGSSNFEVVMSYHPDKNTRVRAYVCPSNSHGIYEELSDAVLLKAAMGMAGK